ncbi:hypothetical protein NA56DRAFT_211267 [Hyaloscypha hepaticicola]|uniref:Uncharacterized protein n=1 Tax=Hyaloscypha hepaticicola TaxID=2082293 RepID=A0A2J6PY45_9HELO|nr:hypothetical protein NA56DRAFT_211267 [Hyaloscypha hepaticicola]
MTRTMAFATSATSFPTSLPMRTALPSYLQSNNIRGQWKRDLRPLHLWAAAPSVVHRSLCFFAQLTHLGIVPANWPASCPKLLHGCCRTPQHQLSQRNKRVDPSGKPIEHHPG